MNDRLDIFAKVNDGVIFKAKVFYTSCAWVCPDGFCEKSPKITGNHQNTKNNNLYQQIFVKNCDLRAYSDTSLQFLQTYSKKFTGEQTSKTQFI